MERRLLTLLMLSAFGMNVSVNGSPESNINEQLDKLHPAVIRCAKEAAKKAQEYYNELNPIHTNPTLGSSAALTNSVRHISRTNYSGDLFETEKLAQQAAPLTDSSSYNFRNITKGNAGEVGANLAKQRVVEKAAAAVVDAAPVVDAAVEQAAAEQMKRDSVDIDDAIQQQRYADVLPAAVEQARLAAAEKARLAKENKNALNHLDDNGDAMGLNTTSDTTSVGEKLDIIKQDVSSLKNFVTKKEEQKLAKQKAKQEAKQDRLEAKQIAKKAKQEAKQSRRFNEEEVAKQNTFKNRINEEEVAKQNTFTNRTRAAFGSAWSGAKHYGTKAKDGAKYCGTKAKNAALWAPKKAVNTTFGGKMNSLSTDWTNLTTGLTPLTTGLDKTQKMNSVKQLSSNVWGSIKQLSSNAWTNKKASAKIAAATVATGVGAYYAGKLVKSASKSLYGKYQARKAAAKEAADKNAEAARVAAAEETARKPVTVVAQNPMTEVLAKLNAGQALNDADKVVVENAYRTFWSMEMPLESNPRNVRKAFIFNQCKIEVNTNQHRAIDRIVVDIKKPEFITTPVTTVATPVVADATTITPVATPAVTDEIVTPAAEQVVGRVAQIKAGIAKAGLGIIGASQKGWVKVKNGAAFLYNNRPFQYNVSKKSDAPSAVKSASESTIEAESKSETSPTSSVGDAPGSIAFTFNGR